MNNITGSPITTILGIVKAGIAGLYLYSASGGKMTWQIGTIMFLIAAIDAAKNDNSFNMGAIDKMVLGHVEGQLKTELNKQATSQPAGK